MASKPQVTLTFAGDSTKLEQSFDSVGASSKRMADDVGASSASVAESGAGFDRAGEAADGAEGKAQGFSDTLTGVADIGAGTSEIMKGNLFEGFVMAGQGGADLAGGLASFVIPALKNMTLASISNAASSARSSAAFVAQRGITLAGAAATNIGAAAMRGFGLALRFATGPVGLVIAGVALLTAGVIWAYKNVGWFRAGVQGAMKGVQTAFGWAITKGGELVNWFKALPGKIGGFMSGVGSAVSAPFRAAFAGIKSAWNNTVGGRGFSVPGWIPGLGGKDFRIPYFHTGGIVSGALGSESLAMVKAGERITAGSNSGGGVTIILKSDGTSAGRALLEVLRKAIKVEAGGNVEVALSS